MGDLIMSREENVMSNVKQTEGASPRNRWFTWRRLGRTLTGVIALVVILGAGLELWRPGFFDTSCPVSVAYGEPLESDQRNVRWTERRLAWWIARTRQDPVDIMVRKAREKRVLVVGSDYKDPRNLTLLIEMIPELYLKADVRRLAVDACLASDNAILEWIVTAPTLDRDAIMAIAGHDATGGWTYQDYRDLLTTVWQLNQSLNGAEPFLIVGLNTELENNEPSMGEITQQILGNIPIWGRFHALIFKADDVSMESRDDFMIRQAQELFRSVDQRGICWIDVEAPESQTAGTNRSATLSQRLAEAFKDDVWQIQLQEEFWSAVARLEWVKQMRLAKMEKEQILHNS